MAVAGNLSIADLVAFFLYLDNFYQPVRTLGNSMEAVTEAMAGFERLAEILTVEPEIASPKVPIPPCLNPFGARYALTTSTFITLKVKTCSKILTSPCPLERL